MGYEHFTQEITLRDQLAIDRTDLANSRTGLAYLKTCMLIALSGFTIFKIQGPSPLTRTIFIAGILISIVLLLYGFTKYLYYARALASVSKIKHKKAIKKLVKQKIQGTA